MRIKHCYSFSFWLATYGSPGQRMSLRWWISFLRNMSQLHLHDIYTLVGSLLLLTSFWPCKKAQRYIPDLWMQCCVSTIISQQSLLCRGCWHLIWFLDLSWLCAKFVCTSDMHTHSGVLGRDGWSDPLSVTFFFLVREPACACQSFVFLRSLLFLSELPKVQGVCGFWST